MTFTERLAALKPNKTGLPCPVGVAAATMAPEDREYFELEFFAEPRVLSNIQFYEFLNSEGERARELGREGWTVTKSSVNLHRRRECRCFVGKDSR